MESVTKNIVDSVGRVLLGKEQQVKLSLACLLAKGHLLIEDLPGMGKTTLAHALAKVLGLDYQRVQCTSDMLPADIIGFSIYNQKDQSFTFHQGPVFTQVLLADEINRTSPKTQSALLEAMEERQVTVDGQTRPLPHPFFVMATQNPSDQSGTYLLPESQLDRFLMRVQLGYPDPQAERRLYEGLDPREQLQNLKAQVGVEELLLLQQKINQLKTTDTLLAYVERLVQFTRSNSRLRTGLSPRAALAIIRAAKAWAFIEGREHVIPEDVQAIFDAVVLHRLRNVADYSQGDHALSEWILNQVPVVA
jgi:MoxR-like ATPase